MTALGKLEEDSLVVGQTSTYLGGSDAIVARLAIGLQAAEQAGFEGTRDALIELIKLFGETDNS